jgi:hypothetical protein
MRLRTLTNPFLLFPLGAILACGAAKDDLATANADLRASVRGAPIETWSDLSNVIVTNDVKSIDELLQHLPDEYIAGFTLVYRTRALGQERVTPARPRVLLFGKDAKFVLAYNSHTTGGTAQPGDVESIETLAFDDATGESVLREVVFDGRVPDLAKVEANPERCLSCHGHFPDNGHSARGLWDPYNSWSGVYGSLSRGGIDFMKLDTNELRNFQTFLEERGRNPRYTFLPLRTQKLSELPADTVLRPFNPATMNDAQVFSDGYTTFPNQMIGMYLGDYNFYRIGNVLADLDPQKRAAFQYLIKGLSLDEGFAKPDIDDKTNPTDVNKKKPDCLAKIASFLPTSMSKLPFDKFGQLFLQKLRNDYAPRKSAAEVDNMGLSKLGAGFDPQDPFDENRDARGLVYDSINAATKFHLTDPARPGLTGDAALFYLFYLMDLPSEDVSTAVTRGTNVTLDQSHVLSGSTSLYYGNSTRCYTPNGTIKSTVVPYDITKFCFSEGIEEFFTRYLPKRFYEDGALDGLSCDDLAVKSRAALTAHFAGGAPR